MPAARPDLRLAASNAIGAPGADAGEHLLIAQGLEGLRAALDTAQPDSGWLHFWRGYLLQFDDLGPAREAWARAEACFEREGDAEGLELAACALLQCSLLDNLSYIGFDSRAQRVARVAPQGQATTPLALFRGTARLMLAFERRESAESVAGDIEQAFAALGAGIDPAVALRAATAALPML